MKQGWERKKLGDVATYVNGFAFKPEQWVDNGIPIIRIQNLNNPDAPYNYCDIQIPSKYIVEKGDILISWSASLGVYEWLYDKGYLNQHIFKVVFDKGDISKYYLKYAVSAKLNDMEKQLHGATMKHIVKKDFDNTLIPVPPLPEQEKIVSELDCLSGIIEKKRQQLKELDALAQSIFYEMFGDPVTNEKGWEVKKLGEVAYIGLGFTHTPEYVEEGVAFLSVKDISSGEICWDKIKYVSQQEYESAPKGAKPKKGDIMFCRVGTMGKPIIVDTDIPFCTFVSLGYLHLLDSNVNNVYVKYWMLSHAFDEQVEKNVKGIAVKNLNTGWLKTFEIQVPPLPLQQTFASKIEAIEKQKALIKQSLGEVETLFNARMDFYFN